MAPIKFEEHIKEQLDKREITPSERSWEKLSSRLDKAERKPARKWWLSVAAAVIVVMIASLLFTETRQEHIPVVDTPVETEKESNNNNIIIPETRLATETKKSKAGTEKTTISSENHENEPLSATVQDINNTSRIARDASDNRGRIEAISVEPAKLEQVAETRIQARTPNFFPQNQGQVAVSQNSKVVSEVDALLAEASRDIREERKNIEARVAAEVLLNDVEYELDQSFRMEVFDFLKDEFQKAKTAIATRND